MTIIKPLGLLQTASAFGCCADCAVRVPSVSLSVKKAHITKLIRKSATSVFLPIYTCCYRLPRLLAWIKLLF